MWETMLGQAAAGESCVQIARQQCYRLPTAATVAAAANVATAEDEEKPNEQKREVAPKLEQVRRFCGVVARDLRPVDKHFVKLGGDGCTGVVRVNLGRVEFLPQSQLARELSHIFERHHPFVEAASVTYWRMRIVVAEAATHVRYVKVPIRT